MQRLVRRKVTFPMPHAKVAIHLREAQLSQYRRRKDSNFQRCDSLDSTEETQRNEFRCRR